MFGTKKKHHKLEPIIKKKWQLEIDEDENEEPIILEEICIPKDENEEKEVVNCRFHTFILEMNR